MFDPKPIDDAMFQSEILEEIRNSPEILGFRTTTAVARAYFQRIGERVVANILMWENQPDNAVATPDNVVNNPGQAGRFTRSGLRKRW